MKSLTHAIIGVTSGVAAFVVLDLMRHHGVELPRIDWERPVLAAAAASAPGDGLEEHSPVASQSSMPVSNESLAESIAQADSATLEKQDGTGEDSIESIADATVEESTVSQTARAATGTRAEPAAMPAAQRHRLPPGPPPRSPTSLGRASEPRRSRRRWNGSASDSMEPRIEGFRDDRDRSERRCAIVRRLRGASRRPHRSVSTIARPGVLGAGTGVVSFGASACPRGGLGALAGGLLEPRVVCVACGRGSSAASGGSLSRGRRRLASRRRMGRDPSRGRRTARGSASPASRAARIRRRIW